MQKARFPTTYWLHWLFREHKEAPFLAQVPQKESAGRLDDSSLQEKKKKKKT